MNVRALLFIISILNSTLLFGFPSSFNGVMTDSKVQHATLVLSDQNSRLRTTAIPDGFSLNLSFSNQHYARQRPLSSAERLPLLKAELSKIAGGMDAYFAQNTHFIEEIKNLTSSLKAIVSLANDQVFAMQVCKGLLVLQNKVPSDSMLGMYFNEALAEIRPIIAHENGILKSFLTNSEVKKLNRIVDAFKASADAWYKEHGAATSAEKTLERFTTNSFYDSSAGSTQFKDLFSDVFNVNNFQEFKRFESLCDVHSYRQAYELLQKCTSEAHKKIMHEKYIDRFYKDYSKQGIYNKYLNDPNARELAATLPESLIPSEYNFEFEKRYIHKNILLKNAGISNPSSATQEIVYRMIDLQDARPEAIIDFITTHLSNDHTDPNMQQAHKELCHAHNALPKNVQYCSEVANAKFSEKIHSKDYAADRSLLAKIGLLNTKNPPIKIQVERFVRYLQMGCSDAQYASSSRIVAHDLGRDLLDNKSFPFTSLNDFSIVASIESQNQIRETIVEFLAEHAKNYQSGYVQGESIQTIVAKMDELYGQMQNGDWKAERTLRDALIPTFSAEILLFDLKKLGEAKFLENEQIFCTRWNDIVAAIHEMEQNGPQYSSKTPCIDGRTQFYMWKERKLSLTAYLNEFKGHQLDHAIYKAHLDDFKLSAELHNKGILDSKKALFESANRSNEMVYKFLKARDYQTAISLSTFTYRVLNYVKEACMSAGQGVMEGLNNIETMVAHPLETGQKMARDLYHIGCALNYCVDRACALGDKLLLDPSQGLQDIREYCQQTDRLIEKTIDRLNKITLNDFCREGARFATETFLLGEIIEFGGIASRAVQAESIALVNEFRAEQAAESLIAATAEGIEIEVGTAQSFENAFYKESAGRISINGAERSASREIVLPKVQTYEQARNIALEIIGEVDAHKGIPHIGRLGVCENKIVGRRWYDYKVIMRLDYAPNKGPHINISDFREGRGIVGTEICIPFEGTEETVNTLLNHMNSKASLEQAKIILQEAGCTKDLDRLYKTINDLNK